MSEVPTRRRDYYEVLGVSREADPDEIRRAFHSLARELHPDVSPAAEAERQFTELAEAYGVLSKPDKRLLYDRFGVRGQSNGFADRVREAVLRDEATPAGDIVGELEVGHFEALRGTTRAVRFDALAACPRCEGVGRVGALRPCSPCRGSGRRRTVSENGGGRLLQVQPCSDCRGSGRVGGATCGGCDGEGSAIVSRALRVRIQPGVEDGQTVRIRGEGLPYLDGGAPGDAFVVVRVLPPPSESRALRSLALVGLVTALALIAKLALG